MEQREIMQRCVGILTEALEMRRRLRADPDADVTADSAVAGLLEDMLPRIPLPADAGAREVAEIVTEKLGPAIVQITSALTFASSSSPRSTTRAAPTFVRRRPALHLAALRARYVLTCGQPPCDGWWLRHG
ncbi:hypothetical protein SALBM217S_01785 [Streptomyces griseoloalbus]